MMRSSCVWFFGFALLSACSVHDGMKNMEHNTERMNQTTQKMSDTTARMEEKTSDLSDETKKVRGATGDMLAETKQMNATTQQMQASTAKVAEVTEKMAETTEEVKETSNDLREATINLYDDARQGAASELRNHARQFMKATPEQLSKIGYAAQYFMGFEFQLWKGINSDNATKMAALRRDAVDELVRTVYEFIPEKRTISPLSKSENMKNLYALCGTLHMVNSNGELLRATLKDKNPDLQSKSTGDKQLTSMLDLLQDGLSAKADLENGTLKPEELKPHQRAVLEHEGVVVYLLQVRANFLTAMTAQRLIAVDGERLSNLGRLRKVYFSWTAKTAQRNTVELDKFVDLLSQAQASRDFLTQIGAAAPLDRTLKRLLRNMRLADAELYDENPVRSELLHKLADVVDQLAK